MFVLVSLSAVAVASFALFHGGAAPSSQGGSMASPTQATVGTATVDGLPVHTVAGLLAERAAGKAVGGPLALRGYWSVRRLGNFCNFSRGQPGALEIYCADGQWGITDADEAILEFEAHDFRAATQASAKSAHLTPWFASDAIHSQLFMLPASHWPPVPIVVLGHFDDPQAAACRPEAITLCKDRFVIDRVVTFDPTAVPAPTASPMPTPFPVADPPAPPFTEQQCFAGLPKSFIGWAKVGDLGISLEKGWDPNEYVFAMVTRDLVAIGDPTVQGEDTWHADPAYPGHQVRWWGRQACFTQEAGTIYGGTIAGSTYLEVDDGRHIVAPYPFF
ncbi:MAG: hypothetical protein ACRDF7_05205 [Candidatus Limnocylindrales bacterium]